MLTLVSPSPDSRDASLMSTDRRLHPRSPVRIDATVVCNDGLLRIPAVVVDQSETGVRLRLDADLAINSQCYLLFNHRIEPFRVAWQARRSVGLSFVSQPNVAC